jgi:diguanylate cyclase (GGDEF)-like protein
VSGSVPTWSVALQCVVAGTVLGLVALETGWLRHDGAARRAAVRRTRAGRPLAWSAALAAVGLLGGLLGLVADPRTTLVVLTLRFVALGAALTLALPAIHAFVGGPRVRYLAMGIGVWYAVATSLWLATDLVLAGLGPDGLPVYGPLATAVDLVPVVVVAGYVGRVLRGRRMTPMGALLTVTGFLSAALLVVSSFPPPTALTELLKGVWALPVVLGLQALASASVTELRRETVRLARMREVVAAVANAARLAPGPAELLDLARDEASDVLGCPVEATLVPLARDRVVARFTATAPLDAEGAALLADLGWVVSATAERHALSDRLRDAALVDGLTDLPSLAALDEHVACLLGRDLPVAMLYVDVERLAEVNDHHGRRTGDRVLRSVADHLAAVVGAGGYVARVSGDEFAVVLDGVLTAEQLRLVAHAIRDDLTTPQQTPRPTLTVGIAHAAGADGAQLLRDAAAAALEARRTHAGIAYYDERLRERGAGHAAARAELEEAVAEGRIVAHFQPVADPVTLEVVSLEVLARWQDGDVLRPPAAWISLAEETGLIVEIGKQMFAAARAGMERFGLPVAVNVAARQLDEPEVVRHIEESWGPDAWDRLTIEVTESAVAHDAQHARQALAELARRGVRIALDDFGTGYNALARLGAMPLHVLKIDKSLLDHTATTEGRAVLQAVVQLAAAHHLEVIAEGVEQRTQLAAMVELGVDLVQGNLIGRPAAQVVARLGGTPTQRVAPAPVVRA